MSTESTVNPDGTDGVEVTVNLHITSCLQCPHHEVQADPDPNDWFCADDQKVVCMKVKRTVAGSERPHHVNRKNIKIPSWCPFNKK